MWVVSSVRVSVLPRRVVRIEVWVGWICFDFDDEEEEG